MSDLKTLKDLVHKNQCSNCKRIKEEAIRYIKFCRKTERLYVDQGKFQLASFPAGAKIAFIEFFNITEEELQ